MSSSIPNPNLLTQTHLFPSIPPNPQQVWKHHNLRLAYVAQHSFHHVEQHLEETPVDYFKWRYVGVLTYPTHSVTSFLPPTHRPIATASTCKHIDTHTSIYSLRYSFASSLQPNMTNIPQYTLHTHHSFHNGLDRELLTKEALALTEEEERKLKTDKYGAVEELR